MVCLDGFVYFNRAVTSIVVRCSTTGAVHLDMTDCVDTLGFLLAVDGWLALRPRPSVFMADGGTNFGGGDSAVQDMAKKGQIDLARAQSHLDTKFRFAPPRAPRFRDLVEGFVEATKAAVHSAVHAHTFADEEYFDRAMTSIVVRCSTTGAVHLDMMDCVDTSGFLLAVKGLLALGTRPSVFMADGGTGFKGGHSALQDIEEKGRISLAKVQSHFNIMFQYAPPRAPRFRGLVEGFVGKTKAEDQ
jgi:hypothetical protein